MKEEVENWHNKALKLYNIITEGDLRYNECVKKKMNIIKLLEN